MPKPTLILASGSPRRRQLLEEAGYEFTVHAPHEHVECGICSESGPAGLVTEAAFRKAAAVREELRRQGEGETRRQGNSVTILVSADTVAECDGLILGKPRDEDDARVMLRQMRGKAHRVLTGLCVWPLDQATPNVRLAVTQLRMDDLSDAAINDYLSTGLWEGKAGAFGYQDRLGWVHIESGSASNVVGLPMELLAEMLREVGWPYWTAYYADSEC
jgi:septum formation protein